MYAIMKGLKCFRHILFLYCRYEKNADDGDLLKKA